VGNQRREENPLSAATAPDLQLVSQPEASITYVARRSDLRLTMKPRYPVNNPVTGQREGVSRGVFCGFRDGTLRIPREGKVVLMDTLNGGESEEIEAADVHEWLQKHRRYGDRSEGFWMLEQPAPPVSPQEIDRLMEAAARWDVATLEAVLEQERAGWGRADLISTAERQVERIRAMEAERDAQVAAAREEADKARVAAEKDAEEARAALAKAQKAK
jgi:hypothetical protein